MDKERNFEKMVNGVDIEQVKNYNTQLKQYKEQASRVTAQIEYSTKDLANLCNELSTELGKAVTPENIEDIYNEFMTSIKNTLDTGNAILAQIAADTASQQAAQASTPQASPVMQSQANNTAQQSNMFNSQMNMGVNQQATGQQSFANMVGQSSFFPNGVDLSNQHIVSL